MEIFYSIQGEGYHQGTAATFIRLAGCEVGCHWCDVKESWHTEGYPKLTPDEIIDQIKDYPAKMLIITGGEPTMYDLTTLTRALKDKGYNLNLETSGAYPITGTWDWICFSPKKFLVPMDDVYQKAHELKAIVYNKSDFKWGESFVGSLNTNCKLYFQPEWSKSDQMTAAIVEYVKANPNWQISLQTHKFLDIP